jgi:hypothetical protein
MLGDANGSPVIKRVMRRGSHGMYAMGSNISHADGEVLLQAWINVLVNCN